MCKKTEYKSTEFKNRLIKLSFTLTRLRLLRLITNGPSLVKGALRTSHTPLTHRRLRDSTASVQQFLSRSRHYCLCNRFGRYCYYQKIYILFKSNVFAAKGCKKTHLHTDRTSRNATIRPSIVFDLIFFLVFPQGQNHSNTWYTSSRV